MEVAFIMLCTPRIRMTEWAAAIAGTGPSRDIILLLEARREAPAPTQEKSASIPASPSPAPHAE